VVSKLGFPLVRYPLTFDDEDLEGIEGWIQCVPVPLLLPDRLQPCVLAVILCVCETFCSTTELNMPFVMLLAAGRTFEQQHHRKAEAEAAASYCGM
jgi:hypothetical protein